MGILLSHPTGNNFVRETANGLLATHILDELHLSVAVCGHNCFSRIASLPGMSEIRRRSYDPTLRACLNLHPGRELGRLLASRVGLQSLIRHETGLFSVDAVYQAFDRKVAQGLSKSANITGVYCYEDAALETFRAAKKRGIVCLYDLPIAYWETARKLLEEEALRLPKWAPTLVGTKDSAEKCARKDKELEMADAVICPSNFVYNSLPEVVRQAKPIAVIPFGSPSVAYNSIGDVAGCPKSEERKPLKILFAGSMTQRKGLGDLFTAMALLDPAKFELHVLGSPIMPMAFYREQFPDFVHHPPRAHSKVLELMRACDVFVLPSIVEGRALVQQEALASGLPIVVTKNAGAEDLVEDGKAGLLVPIRDPQALAEALNSLELDRDRLKQMKLAAPVKACEVTWKAYRTGIANFVEQYTCGVR